MDVLQDIIQFNYISKYKKRVSAIFKSIYLFISPKNQ